MKLAGPTITLRYPQADDAGRLFELASDPQVANWFSWGPYEHIEQPASWIARTEAERESGHDLAFVVEHPEDGVVGVTGLNELSIRDRRAAVGTWIGRDWWGTGINAESKALVAHLAFEICDLRRLTAYSNVDNERSTAALQRVGFEREGTLRRWHRHGADEFDVHIFRLLPEHWRIGFECRVQGKPPAAWIFG